VKHAGSNAIEKLAPLLAKLRAREPLQEKRPGVFYLRSRAFIHFHEDEAGLFVDVRLRAADFERMRVTTSKEQAVLVWRVDQKLAEMAPPRGRKAP